ncbi:ATPase, involved in cytoplasmic translational initiation [Schizosaccharomyces osmophilus]|uniref:ATPase, involved in cytoplasmic translational initiation n=1 Tax=Schizosaccharomyces osmophilus TaxID=2545709 RepID=A0AAE9WDR1_9SCHI|nr:ATPase, involved in cytoplasmic translational initiation [Schizosaccharomyces osmophilus]WBW74557.1 ATPase, involved in cytoplasmic translational initiation [Schizosaccharomyces osmophilus]
MARGRRANQRDADLDLENIQDEIEEVKPAPKPKTKKNKKATKKSEAVLDEESDSKSNGSQNQEEEEDVSPPKKSSGQNKKPVNAFAAFADEQEDEEESESEDSGVDEDPKKKKKSGKKASRKNAFDSLNEGMDEMSLKDEEKEESSTSKKEKKKSKKSDEPKKDRKTRKKEEKAQKIASLVESKEENDSAGNGPLNQNQNLKDGLLSGRLIFAYASGQKVSADGSDPSAGITVTGNLLSPPNSRDLQVEKLSVSAYGKHLIKDSELSLINGRRYGLIAPNGTGKSTLLHAIACGQIPAPQSLDFYLLDREYMGNSLTCVEAVLDINEQERKHLETIMEDLLDDPDKNAVELDTIQTRLTELETDNSEHLVYKILKGLQFTDEMISKRTEDLSGGWRMRIALARILFIKPTLMMLDEPTNHLDLEAVAYLEEYLTHEMEGHTVLITCHTQDTLNEVCTDIVHLHHHKLDYYSGNYDVFLKVRGERDAQLAKKARQQEKDMSKLQNKLNMTGSDQQKKAKAKVKAMDKRLEKDKQSGKVLDEEIIQEKQLVIRFQECGGGIPSPAVKFQDVSFNYPEGPTIFSNLNFGLDLNSRVALVGPNGAGKTTLIRLILEKIQPTVGSVVHHHGLRLALFNQHMGDQLDMRLSAVDWLRTKFGNKPEGEMRRIIGRYGLTGKSQVIPMSQLSDGQRRRVLFAFLGMTQPHILLLDEPTNALDIDTIDALADALNNFDGGVIFITHDFRLIDQVAEEIWVVKDNTVKEFDGEIRDYKMMLKEQIAKDRENEKEVELAKQKK